MSSNALALGVSFKDFESREFALDSVSAVGSALEIRLIKTRARARAANEPDLPAARVTFAGFPWKTASTIPISVDGIDSDGQGRVVCRLCRDGLTTWEYRDFVAADGEVLKLPNFFTEFHSGFRVEILEAHGQQEGQRVLLKLECAPGARAGVDAQPAHSDGPAAGKAERPESPDSCRRILIVDSTMIGRAVATAQVKQLFLEGWPEDRLLQVYEREGRLELRRWPEPPDNRLLNDDELLAACREFQPEVIYFRPVCSERLFAFAERVVDALARPLVVHMMDDWPEQLRFQDPARFEKLDRSLRRLLERASARLSISQAMSDAYLKRYGHAFVPLANGVDVDAFPIKDWFARGAVTAERPFVIRYMGALADDMTFASVMDVARAVAELGKSLPVRFEIFTMNWYLDKAKEALQGLAGTSVQTLVPKEKYPEILSGSDALLIAYNFDQDSVRYIGLSMANKLPECLATAAPLLAYGPREVATIAYLEAARCAQVVSERNQELLCSQIEYLVRHPGYCRAIGVSGRAHAATRHDKKTVIRTFRAVHDAAVRAAGPGSPVLCGPYARSEAAHYDETDCVAKLFSGALSGERMVDVGAHHGWALAPFLEMGWNVLAFEPDERNREQLLKRIARSKNPRLVTLDPRAVSDASRQGVSLYRSEESDGISGLTAFHPSHREAERVNTVTLREALAAGGHDRIDFLKVDTEGHDLFVLQGFPWERIKPTVIECEFEDAKTVALGYAYHDLARFLVEMGYSVYVSEWHPIVRYGIRHDWNRLARYPCELMDAKAWGNLLAFRSGVDERELAGAVRSMLKLGKPAPAVAAKPAPPEPVSKPQPDSAQHERLVILMNQPVAGENWHRPEFEGRFGFFCWTGPGSRATLALPVRRDREMLVVVTYYATLIAEQMSGLRIEIDGVTVPHRVYAGLVPKCIVASLPARGAKPGGQTGFALVLPRTVSPGTLSAGSTDQRLLGLGVKSVAVFPAEPGLPAAIPVSRVQSILRRWRSAGQSRPAGDFPFSHFDGVAYLETYPDVADALRSHEFESALHHYYRHGHAEGRHCTLASHRAPNKGSLNEWLRANFDGLAYLQANPDVARAVRRDEMPSAFYHYQHHGQQEQRTFLRAPSGEAAIGNAHQLIEHTFQLQSDKYARALRLEMNNQRTEHEKLAGNLAQLRAEAARIRGEFASASAARDAREQMLAGQLDAARASLGELEQGLLATPRAGELEQVRQQVDRIRGEIATASGSRDAREQALVKRLDAVTGGLGEVQKSLPAAARASDLERLGQEVAARASDLARLGQETTRNLERLGLETTGNLDRLGLETTRNLDRLGQEAARNMERVRSDIAALAALREAREGTIGAQIDGLKANVGSATSRAELAEVKVTAVQRDLESKVKAEIEGVQKQAATTISRVTHANLNAFNTLGYQAFARQLWKGDATRLCQFWAPLLGVEIKEQELFYLANRICSIENVCLGRLAASIQDVLLRILVARACKSRSLEVFEIGTLFGLGIIAMHETLGPLFEQVHFTAMDPLKGYYGRENRDVLTGVPISRQVFEHNLRRAGMGKGEVTLIPLMSTDPRARKRVPKRHYDVLVIDADHSYDGVKHDAVHYVASVKAGGYVIFDDYGNQYWPEVKRFVDAEVMPRTDLRFVGAEWHTAVFQVLGAKSGKARR